MANFVTSSKEPPQNDDNDIDDIVADLGTSPSVDFCMTLDMDTTSTKSGSSVVTFSIYVSSSPGGTKPKNSWNKKYIKNKLPVIYSPI